MSASSSTTARGPRPAPRPGLTDLVGHVPGAVLDSPWTTRLAGVSFLGALDAAPGCAGGGSRLDHGLGAARLALAAARTLGLDPAVARLLVTAAFLHDVGHWPFSHSAEAVFRAGLGADHHELSRWILCGGGPVARGASLAPALEDSGLQPERVLALIEGRGQDLGDLGPDAELAALLTGPVNVDTLEGIPRAARAFGLKTVRLPARAFVRQSGRLAIAASAVPAIDRFWRLKDRVYRNVINSPAHASLELRFASALGRSIDRALLDDLVTLDDARLSERAVPGGEAPRPAARASDTSARYAAAADPALAPTRWLRRYSVDESVKPAAGGLRADDWPRRWTSARERWFLVDSAMPMQMLLPCLAETEGAEA